MDRFRHLAESLPHMVWTCQPDGTCDYLSPQWLSYTGVLEAPQLGYGWLAQLHPDDVAETRQRWGDAVEHGGPFDTEYRVRRHDGSYRWFKTRALAMRDEHGRILRWYGSNTDIQDLRDAQDAANRAALTLEQRVADRTAELDRANVRLSKLTLQLQAAQRLTRVGSWELDARSGSATWSDELFHTFGLDPSSASPSYREHEALFEPESWRRLQAAVSHALTTGGGYELTLAARRTDGAILTTVAQGEAVRDASGQVGVLVGTFQDVTARAERDRELARLTDRLQLATSAASIGVWEWELGPNVLVWDATMYRLYGVVQDGSTFPVEAFQKRVHPSDAGRVAKEISEALAGGKPFDSSFRIVRPSGVTRHLRAAATLHRDERGRAIRMVGVTWDVSEQVDAERALRDNEALLRSLLLHAGPAMIATRVDGTITLFNHAAEALLGYKAHEVIGLATTQPFHDRAEVEARRGALEKELDLPIVDPFEVFVAKARRGQVDAREWTYIRKDGARVPVLLTVTGIRLASGELVGFLGVAVDLSTQKATEGELLGLNRQLTEQKGQMEVLLQEIHHRVKNNLQIIASLVHLQTRQAPDGPIRSALTECRTRILTIALIHEQLYQSKDYARIPFYEYADRLARNVVAAAGVTAVHLSFDLQRVTLPVESAIPCGLVLNELLTNALKHAFPDGRSGNVRVVLRQTDEAHVELAVTDDGVGLPRDFDVSRLKSLGVQLVHDLCAQVGGTLTVSSAEGTTFALSIPYSSVPSSRSGRTVTIDLP